MLKCDYCCSRPSSLEINCLKCSPSRPINICFKCSINVNQLREHSKQHPLSTYQLIDIPLDENKLNSWLCNDEINLIEIIETCGLGNWIDIGLKMNKNSNDCQKHFEDIYLSQLNSLYSIYFQSFPNNKKLFGENKINDFDYKYKSIIYPPLLIDNEQQKMLTYMPFRDEYEREYQNQYENRLPILNNEQQQQQQQQDGSTLLLDKAKLAILRSYKQIIQRRLQLKHFIRDYALPFNYSNDQQIDIHQISRFLSADEYQRLIFNHKRIRSLLEELGCSTSSNDHNQNHQSPSKKRNNLTNSEKRRRRAQSIVVDESSSSSSTSSSSCSTSSSSASSTISSSSSSSSSSLKSNLSLSSTNESEQTNLNIRRRSVRRVSSSSSTETSSKPTNSIKEPLYTRRRVNQSDNNNIYQRTTRSTGNTLTTSDISWDSTDDEINQFDNYNGEDDESTVASRTRSHTPPNHHIDKKQKTSPNGKRTNNHLNGSSKSNMFDPTDESTPKVNRMLTRHQLVVQQTSPNKKRKINSNSIDDELIHI